ncbi:MAG: NAD(P)-dependent oxidoreductase [Campylobacterales bacterium]|nr:NAD(P)-dependent oxidoreductase [Campylobacterales bacterium]
MLKVLVTGATGFIGNHVVNFILDNYPNVELITTSTDINKAKNFSWFDKTTYICHDIKDTNKNLFEYFNYPDKIIHLSWRGLPNYKNLFHFEEHLLEQYAFIKNLIVNGATDITITGTCFEYGMKDGSLDENMITNPTNPYGIAKDNLRKFIEQLNKFHEFNFKWVRLFYMYGAGQNENSLFSQLDKAIEKEEELFNMSGGEQIRDYLHVKDVANNIVKVSLQNSFLGVINCSSNKPISVRKFVEDYIALKNSNLKLNLGYYPYPDYEPFAFWGNNSRLKMILGSSS